MTSQTTPGGAITRRCALVGMAASAATSHAALGALASQTLPLHEVVAAHVRDRVGEGGEDSRKTLNLLLPHGSLANVEPVVAQFRQMTGVDVGVHEAHVDEINTELLLDSLSNTQSYDVALPATFGLPDLVASGAIQPLTRFVKRYEPPGFREDILFGTGDSFDGETYGFQADGDAYVMFYHKDMLSDTRARGDYEDRFGRALTIPDTWQELDRQMAFFHRPDEGQWGGALFRTPGYLAWEWWVRFHAKGIWPFSPEMEPQIASDAGVSALEEMIRATDSLCPEVSHLGLFENWERYSRGDIFCNIGWGGSQKYLNDARSAMRGRMMYGPTPGGIVAGELLIAPYFNWGWNYVVAGNSRMPEVAYLFTLFASTPFMSTLAVRSKDGFFDPFRPEHYADAAIRAAYTPAFLDIHRASLEEAIPDLYLKDQGAYWSELSKWLVRALSGEVSPQKALERVAQRWHLITDGAGRSAQIQRWAQLRAKYPDQIQRALRNVS